MVLVTICSSVSYAQLNKVGTAAAPLPNGDIHLTESITVYYCFNELTGSDSLKFSVQNNSADTVSGLELYWESDGSTQGPLVYGNSIRPNEDVEVTIGSFSFNNPGTYTFKAWGTLNGMNVVNTHDDTIQINVEIFAVSQPSHTSDVFKCLNDSVKLVGAAGYVGYDWVHSSQTSQNVFVENSGEYVVNLTDDNGCIVQDTVEVVDYAYPNQILGSDTAICDGDVAHLRAPLGFDSYTWSNSGSSTNLLDVSQAGVFQVTLMDSNNCSYEDEIEVSVNPLPVVNMPSTVDICQGEQAVLNATDGIGSNTYEWNSGSVDPVLSTPNAGVYDVTVTNAHGCKTVASTTVDVNPLPVPALPNDTVLCNGESQTLSVNAAPYQSFDWSTNEHTSSITVSAGGLYTVTVTDGNNCKGVAAVHLVEKNVSVDLGEDWHICQNEFFTINPSGVYDSYEWSTGSQDSFITINQGGTYILEVSKYGFCSDSDTIEVDYTAFPSADYLLGNINGNEIEFVNTSADGVSYSWDFSDGASSTDENPVHTFPSAGNYNVKLTTTNVCGVNSITKEVSVGITTIENINRIEGLDVYPNPVSDILTINIKSDNVDYLSIAIQNELGQVVKNWQSSVQSVDHQETISVAYLAKGVYFVSVIAGETFKVKKVVIQ